ncbi:MAG: nitroreductase family protein [Candidatus Lokiarchaeota archaeon]|nr:nitroreductase family protein [Candidatus Lokiarchaeota archaeon]
MDFYDVVRKRRSYRVYKHDMPEDDKVKRILEAARLAPTWGNKQGMEYIVVKDTVTVKRVWNAVDQEKKFVEAPMFIVGIISESGSGRNSNGIKYFPLDCGICFEHLILAATAEGLATCWIGWFNESKVQEVLGIPEKFRVLALTPLGYPIKEKGEVVDRKPLEEIVHYDKF